VERLTIKLVDDWLFTTPGMSTFAVLSWRFTSRLIGRKSVQAEPTECVQRSLASLREVSAIVDAKAPDEAAAFKTWLREISQKVAEAAVEGSFLGFGGVRVSDAETATLRDISKALGMAA
jgi:hypothetical protein